MDAKLGILTGSRAGETAAFSQRMISVGRDPASDLRFHPEVDRAVSARHAALLFEEGSWHVRDLGSTNGTWVNGRRIGEDTPIGHGDRVSFGADGPTVELRLPGASVAGAAPATSSDRRAARWLPRRAPRSRAAVVASALLLSAFLGAVYLGARQQAAWDRERAAMRLEIDSLQGAGARAIAALEQQLLDLRASLLRSENQVRSLRESLARAESAGEVDRVAGLRVELEAADADLRSREAAAALDFRTIQERNRHAVARIFVEFSDGEVTSGTAFAVRPDATLVTSRHVVVGEDGTRQPRRIAVQFSDSEQVWPARLVAVARGVDLAAIKVDNILGDVPTVHALNLRPDTLPAGTPVAMIGFALGGDPPDPDRPGFARPTLSAGVIRRTDPDRIEVEGYGAAGASGSPILDANGEVAAILFGGRATPGDQALFGIPASSAARLLAAIP